MSKHVGRSVRVYWENDQEWFHGVIDDHHPEQGWHVQYFDGDEEWLEDIADTNLIQFEDQKSNLNDTMVSEAKENDNEEEELLVVTEQKLASQAKGHEQDYFASSAENDGMGDLGHTNAILGLDEEEGGDDLERAALTHRLEDLIEDEGVKRVTLDESLQEDPNDPNVAFDLPERGVIMMGHVTGASNLPQPASGETDGRVFFRILYVEGGNKSAMFRCKTPVFTSKEASDLIFPEWKNGDFRFEMVLPAAPGAHGNKLASALSEVGSKLPTATKPRVATAKKGPSSGKPKAGEKAFTDQVEKTIETRNPFVLQGEILVALYRTRAQGGSDFIGQVSFDLSELAASGTTQFPEGTGGMGVQARSTNGSYPVVARSGAIAGDGLAHVDLAIELIWKPEVVEEDEEGAEEKPVLKARTPKQSKPKPTAPKKEKLVAPKTFNAKRKLMESIKIERQNKALAARLKAHATGQSKYRSVDKAEDVYAIPRENLISGKDPPKPRNADEEELHQFRRKAAKMNHAELMAVYTTLKREVAKKKSETTAISATLSRLKLQTKKYELANAKMKKKVETSGGSIARAPDFASETMKNIISAKNKDGYEGLEKIDEGEITGPSQEAKQQPGEGEDLNGDGVVDEAEATATRAAYAGQGGIGYAQYLQQSDGEDFSNVDDPELREHLREHVALQDARRRLVARIQAAKLACRDNQASLEDAQMRDRVARKRLGSAFSKLGNQYAGQSSGPASEEDKRMDEDLQAIERVREVTLELSRSQAMLDSQLHLGQLQDTIEELRGVELKLSSLVKDVVKEVEELKSRKGDVTRQTDEMQAAGTASKLRERLGWMRERLLALCRKEKVARFDQGADNIELEALRMQLRRQQKDMEE